MSYKDGQFFLGEPDFTGPKPIYNQHLLKDTELIFWVEGEAVADALVKLGVTATTSGSATSHSTANLEPLRGKKIVIWPDNDKAGLKHASEVATLLQDIGCSVATIDICQFELPEGGDFLDWYTDHPNALAQDIFSLNTKVSESKTEADEEEEQQVAVAKPVGEPAGHPEQEQHPEQPHRLTHGGEDRERERLRRGPAPSTSAGPHSFRCQLGSRSSR